MGREAVTREQMWRSDKISEQAKSLFKRKSIAFFFLRKLSFSYKFVSYSCLGKAQKRLICGKGFFLPP